MTVRILAAHPTRSAAGQAMVRSIATAVSSRVGPVRLAWLDSLDPTVAEPTLAELLTEVGDQESVIVAPLLLGEGYHDRDDIPDVVAKAAPQAIVTPVLGTDPLLVKALAGRLIKAGWEGEPVVLGATGSSHEAWHSVAAQVAEALGERLDTEVEVGVLTGPGRTVTDTVSHLRRCPHGKGDRRVAVSAYLLAEGFFHGRLNAVGADLTTAPIGAHPALVRLLVDRFEQAVVT
ncbi:MAG: CbiX/SirB N-terminal domain-containing protein [Propionibacteriaceae bacterium]|nr:CbiX/SirB N-terminal domain-containing protein [Propionibacteriaceae bacterium]